VPNIVKICQSVTKMLKCSFLKMATAIQARRHEIKSGTAEFRLEAGSTWRERSASL